MLLKWVLEMAKKKSNGQSADNQPSLLKLTLCGIAGAVCVAAVVAVLVIVVSKVWCFFNTEYYFICIGLLVLALLWVCRFMYRGESRLIFGLVALSSLLIGASILSYTLSGIWEWVGNGNLEATGVAVPIGILAGVAEIMPGVVWFISLFCKGWEERGVDAWISKMSVYSVLWTVLLILSLFSPLSEETEKFMTTCFVSFLILGCLKEVIEALVILCETDKPLI